MSCFRPVLTPGLDLSLSLSFRPSLGLFHKIVLDLDPVSILVWSWFSSNLELV